MNFTVHSIEPGDSPDTLVIKGYFAAHAGVVVDVSGEAPTGKFKYGVSDPELGEAIAAAVANAVSLVGAKNTACLERQGIPVTRPEKAIRARESVPADSVGTEPPASTAAPSTVPAAADAQTDAPAPEPAPPAAPAPAPAKATKPAPVAS